MTPKEALEALIKAWESLPGDQYYRPRIVADWLLQDMKPAIDAARNALKQFEGDI